MAVAKTNETAMQFLARNEKALKSVLPEGVTFDRLMLMIENAIRANPELGDANKVSLVGAVLQCCFLGLEPNDGKHHIALVPYKGIVKAMLEYQGMVELVLKAGVKVMAEVAYHHDEISYEVSTAGPVLQVWKHKPNLDAPRTRRPEDIKLAYAIGTFNDGTYKVEYLTTKEINEAHKKATDIWTKHWSEMAKKTAIRRLYKTLPKTQMLSKALEQEEDDDFDPASIVHELLPATRKDKVVTIKDEIEAEEEVIYAGQS